MLSVMYRPGSLITPYHKAGVVVLGECRKGRGVGGLEVGV